MSREENVEPRKKHEHLKSKSCFHNPMLSCSLIWPLGGILATAIGLYGFFQISSGLSRVNDEMQKIDVDLDFLVLIVQYIVFAVFVTDCSVVIYGFREKIRTRFHPLCDHVHGFFFGCGKFWCKGALTFIVVLVFLLSVLLLVLTEGLWLILVTTDVVCGGTESAAEDIIDIIGGAGDNPVSDVCDAVAEVRGGAFSVWVGSIILLVGQGAMLAYWFKYSTLGLAQPFYVDFEERKRSTAKVAPAAAAEKGGATKGDPAGGGRGGGAEAVAPALGTPVSEKPAFDPLSVPAVAPPEAPPMAPSEAPSCASAPAAAAPTPAAPAPVAPESIPMVTAMLVATTTPPPSALGAVAPEGLPPASDGEFDL